MTRLHPGALAVVLVSAACGADVGSLPPILTSDEIAIRRFFEAITPLVGTDPLECSSNLRRLVVPSADDATPDRQAEWFACAEGARARRRPFLIALEQWNHGHRTISGVLGQADGAVRVFELDSMPWGARLIAGVCESPSAPTRASGRRHGMSCANGREWRTAPMRELWLRSLPLSDDFAAKLRGATGEGLVVDCGLEVGPLHGDHARLSRGEETDAFACAEAARARGSAFRVLFQQPGPHASEIVIGLVGRADGPVSRFRYARLRCDGPNCPSTFDVRPCDQPALVDSRTHTDVSCGPG